MAQILSGLRFLEVAVILLISIMFSIADKLQSVSSRIQKATISAERPSDVVQLLAVSKKHPAEAVLEAYKTGQVMFGENYLSEALEKQETLLNIDPQAAKNIEWHFIGPIQSNKTRAIAENFSWVQSVDRFKIAKRLNEQRPNECPKLNVCIQINIDEEDTKSGILLSEVNEIAEQLSQMERLCLRGLMAIPSAASDDASLSKSMAKLLEAKNNLATRYPTVDTLSMGMSGDLEIAIANGSTMVRVGTDIFGSRR